MIGNKKALYKTMKFYEEECGNILSYLPLTYHITNGLED